MQGSPRLIEARMLGLQLSWSAALGRHSEVESRATTTQNMCAGKAYSTRMLLECAELIPDWPQARLLL
eukprot:4504775-Amphidinium_carterae.1